MRSKWSHIHTDLKKTKLPEFKLHVVNDKLIQTESVYCRTLLYHVFSRAQLFRECQTLFELATKPCSIVFDAFREDSYTEGGEDYLTFSGTTVNIGHAMNPKSGEFVTPEAGLYLFLITCCTFDMKKCLISIRKNGKDVANLFDQDGDTNRVILTFTIIDVMMEFKEQLRSSCLIPLKFQLLLFAVTFFNSSIET